MDITKANGELKKHLNGRKMLHYAVSEDRLLMLDRHEGNIVLHWCTYRDAAFRSLKCIFMSSNDIIVDHRAKESGEIKLSVGQDGRFICIWVDDSAYLGELNVHQEGLDRQTDLFMTCRQLSRPRSINTAVYRIDSVKWHPRIPHVVSVLYGTQNKLLVFDVFSEESGNSVERYSLISPTYEVDLQGFEGNKYVDMAFVDDEDTMVGMCMLVLNSNGSVCSVSPLVYSSHAYNRRCIEDVSSVCKQFKSHSIDRQSSREYMRKMGVFLRSLDSNGCIGRREHRAVSREMGGAEASSSLYVFNGQREERGRVRRVESMVVGGVVFVVVVDSHCSVQVFCVVSYASLLVRYVHSHEGIYQICTVVGGEGSSGLKGVYVHGEGVHAYDEGGVYSVDMRMVYRYVYNMMNGLLYDHIVYYKYVSVTKRASFVFHIHDRTYLYDNDNCVYLVPEDHSADRYDIVERKDDGRIRDTIDVHREVESALAAYKSIDVGRIDLSKDPGIYTKIHSSHTRLYDLMGRYIDASVNNIVSYLYNYNQYVDTLKHTDGLMNAMVGKMNSVKGINVRMKEKINKLVSLVYTRDGQNVSIHSIKKYEKFVEEAESFVEELAKRSTQKEVSQFGKVEKSIPRDACLEISRLLDDRFRIVVDHMSMVESIEDGQIRYN